METIKLEIVLSLDKDEEGNYFFNDTEGNILEVSEAIKEEIETILEFDKSSIVSMEVKNDQKR